MDIEKNIRAHGTEYYGKYYSVYEGTVADNKDPDKLGRVKLSMDIFGGQTHDYWARPRNLPTGNTAGIWFIPAIGDKVWVTFIGGDQRYPMWEYGNATDTGMSLSELYDAGGVPTGIIIKTVSGHSLFLNDADGEVVLAHSAGASVTLDDTNVTVTNGSNKVTVSKSKVLLGSSSASDAMVKATELDSLLDALFNVLNTFTVTVSGAVGTASPASVAALQVIANTLQPLIKSQRVFTDT
ncbi:MAG: hypothetical protein H6550_15935 [Chitinophagales bacterium]|nr:hypothetical protein [Chitinophagales bacterium]